MNAAHQINVPNTNKDIYTKVSLKAKKVILSQR